MSGTTFYNGFNPSDWQVTETGNGSVTFNANGSVTLRALASGDFAGIGGLMVNTPVAGSDSGSVFLLHSPIWTTPENPVGNQGRLRHLIRNFADTTYLTTGYVSAPLSGNGTGYAVALMLLDDGFKLSSLYASFAEGGSTEVTIDGWSVLFASDLQKVPVVTDSNVYANELDVYSVYGRTNVDKWADLDNDENPVAILARVISSIELATEIVNNELQSSRYAFPLHGNATPPKSIVDATAKIAGALLYEGRGIEDTKKKTNPVENRKVQAMKYLARIKIGLATLPIEHNSGAAPTVFKNAET